MSLQILQIPFTLSVFVFGNIFDKYRLAVLIILFALLIFHISRKDFRIQQGSKQRKRKAMVFLLLNVITLLAVTHFQTVYLYLFFFPIILCMLYLSLTTQSILLNYFILIAHVYWLYPAYFVAIFIATTAWMVFSFLVIRINRTQLDRVKKKLAVMERESRKYLQDNQEDGLGIEQHRMAQATKRIAEEKEQFKNLTQILFEIFVPHTCAFYVYEPCENIFILKAHQTQAEDFDSHSLMPSEGIFKLIQSQKKTMQVYDNAIPNMLYYKNKKDIQSVLVCPLVEADQLFGVIIIDHLKERKYHNHEISVVERSIEHFSHIIKDSKIIAQFEHMKQEFSSFYNASSQLNQAFHLQDVLETLLQMAKKIAPYDWGAVILYNKKPNKNMVMLDSAQDSYEIVGQTFPLEYKKNLVSWVIDQMKPLHYNNFKQKYRHSALLQVKNRLPNIFDSVLLLPLYVQDEKIGAVLLMSEKNFFFTRTIQNMLEVMVLHAAIAAKNAITVQNLQKLATTDGLTGLVNHRTFQGELTQEISRSQRYNQELSLMLVDLDYFKKINDEYGHPAGDVILRKTSNFLQKQVRDTDLVARYGGEEFAIILPNTTAEAAKRLAKRMIANIHKQKWEYENIHIPVTFSIGLASFPEHAQDKSGLIERADLALYHAKNTGRDQVCVFLPEQMLKNTQIMEKQLIEKMEKQVQD